MNKKISKKKIFSISLIFLLCVYILLNIYWITQNKNSLSYEDVYFLSVVDQVFSNSNRIHTNLFFSFYPPVSLLITSLFFFMFGILTDNIFLINILFLVLSLPLLYKISGFFYNKKKSYYTLALFLGFPAVVFFIRSYYEQMFLLFFYFGTVDWKISGNGKVGRRNGILFTGYTIITDDGVRGQ